MLLPIRVPRRPLLPLAALPQADFSTGNSRQRRPGVRSTVHAKSDAFSPNGFYAASLDAFGPCSIVLKIPQFWHSYVCSSGSRPAAGIIRMTSISCEQISQRGFGRRKPFNGSIASLQQNKRYNSVGGAKVPSWANVGRYPTPSCHVHALWAWAGAFPASRLTSSLASYRAICSCWRSEFLRVCPSQIGTLE